MPLIRVLDRNEVEHVIEARAGLKLMELLRELDYGVAGVCGGVCSCASCHVYVDASRSRELPAPQPDERELLAELAHLREESRLSCQIQLTHSLDGLRITIAPEE